MSILKLMYRFIAFTSLMFISGFSSKLFAQPANDNCSASVLLCPNTTLASGNQGASAECGAGTAEGDCLASGSSGICYDVFNSVWYKFTSNSNGGTVIVSFSGISCNVGGIKASVLSAATACTPPYTPVACTPTASTTDFSLTGTLSANTPYWVHVTGELSGGTLNECIFSITLSGNAVRDTLIFETADVICGQSKGSVTISQSPPSNPGPYKLNGGATQTSNVFNNLTPGTYTVEVANADGCPYSQSFLIKETQNTLSVDAGEDQNIVPGGKAFLEANTTSDSVIWSPPSGLSDTSSKKPVATPGVTTTYTVTVSTPEGCKASDKVTVFVAPPLQIFNTFTPNDDGKNDTWKILNISAYPEAEVYIYDRWGQRVFYSEGYEEEWKGLSLNMPLPVGTYFYVIDINVESEDKDIGIYKGPVTIIR